MRAPLTERYRNLKGDSENKETEANLLLEEIKLLRERMKEVADETRLKDDLYKQLVRDGLFNILRHGCVRVIIMYIIHHNFSITFINIALPFP